MKPKMSKILKSRHVDISWTADIDILGQTIKFEMIKVGNKKTTKKDALEILAKAENKISEYGFDNESDEIKRLFIVMYLTYKFNGFDFSICHECRLRRSIVMEDFLRKVEKIYNNYNKFNKIEVSISETLKTGQITLYIGDKYTNIKFDLVDKDPIKVMMDFFLKPEKYLEKFGIRKIFIPYKVVAKKEETNGMVLTCVDNYEIMI